MQCAARIVGGAALRGAGSFVGGRAQCTFTIPRTAKGKTVRGTMVLTYQTATATKPFSFTTSRRLSTGDGGPALDGAGPSLPPGYNAAPQGVFPSGQRGRAVNPLALPSEVRILPPPSLRCASENEAGGR